jgi:hypothetical protein
MRGRRATSRLTMLLAAGTGTDFVDETLQLGEGDHDCR